MFPLFYARKRTLIEQRIARLLEEKFLEPEFESYFLIDVDLKGDNKLEVYLDGDSGITLEKCQKISRYLEKFIDEGQWLGEKYTLEVSSPGVRRPLKFPRQYNQHLGRKLEVKLAEGKFEGILTEVKENEIVLEWKERVKEGKKKKTVEIVKEIPFEQIERTIVKISFNKGK